MERVLIKKKEELVVSLIFTIFLLLLASTLMYYVENEAQPEHFSSIPETMWWGIATLTTVGYGDMYPVTGLTVFRRSYSNHWNRSIRSADWHTGGRIFRGSFSEDKRRRSLSDLREF